MNESDRLRDAIDRHSSTNGQLDHRAPQTGTQSFDNLDFRFAKRDNPRIQRGPSCLFASKDFHIRF